MTATRQLHPVQAHDEAPEPTQGAALDGREPGLVETPTAQRITQVFEHARTPPPTIALIYGGAGCSKTSTALRYASDRPRYRGAAHYVNLHAATSPMSMLTIIAESIHANSVLSERRAITVMRDLVVYFRAGDLLILDECQSLRPDALDAVRYFSDEGVGLVLMGNEQVFSTIAGKNRRAMFAQLHSRVGMRLHLPHPTEADADAVLKAWGISGGAGRDYGRQLALGPGGLRQLAQVLRQARIAAAATKRPLDHRLMHAAAGALGLTD